MQLIIDINKEDYEYIRENKGMHYTMTTGICEAIFDGTPLEEKLENIKAEIDESSFETYEKYSEEPIVCNYTINVMQIIDNHITQQKGKQE